MCVEYHNQPESMTQVMTMLNYIFTGIFAIEAFLKLYILGCNYFNDAWNKFDFFIVIMSFFGLLVDLVIGDAIGINPAFIRVLRVFPDRASDQTAQVSERTASAAGNCDQITLTSCQCWHAAFPLLLYLRSSRCRDVRAAGLHSRQ